jgi:two-component system, chemotaxis family, protein-glutamate methylesterase/glutaminase
MAEPTPSDPIRVLIVDDSAVIRGFVNRALQDLPEVAIVGSVGDGQAGVNFAGRELADVIILDIEMPVMDGLTAIPLLMKAQPWARIIMSSTLTLQGAEVSLRAMALGAADYVSKPTSTRELDATTEWKRDLLDKVKALGIGAWQQRQRTGKTGPLPAGAAAFRPAVAPGAPATSAPAPVVPVPPKSRLYEGGAVTLRPVPPLVPEILAIGSSTGGPQALFAVLPHLKNLRQPIVITQHMPKTFTTILADHITKQTGLPCDEAKDGSVLEPGRALLAPGDYHLLFVRDGARVKARLTQDPPENYCRPAVDPMLRSLIEIYGANKILVTILTGMGADGMKGSELVVNAGGMCVGQDQATSVVWGMPGAVATAGLCSAVLPLPEIGPYVRKKAGGA